MNGFDSRQPVGIFAVPAVKLPDGVLISQTPAAMTMAGKILGLYPTNASDEARALQATANAADMISECMAGKPAERMAKWAGVAESHLASSGFCVGSSLTYADFMMYMAGAFLTQKAKVELGPLFTALIAKIDADDKVKRFKETAPGLLPGGK